MGTNAIVGGGVPQAAGFAWAHRHAGTDARLGDLLRRRRGQHRLHAGDDEPRRRLVAAGLLLHREQPVRRLHLRRGGHRRAPSLRPAARASTSPAWKVDGMDPLAVHLAMTEAVEHMRAGRRPDRRRGRHLPLLPPERRLRRQRLRLPRQGGGAGMARARPARPDRRPPRAARPPRGRRRRPRRGRPRQAVMEEIGGVLLEPVPGRQARPAADPRRRVARPRVGRRRGPRRPERDRRRPVVGRRGYAVPVQEEVRRAVAAVMGRRMETDTGVVVMGEDVHRLNGGTNGATRGLTERFPGRVLGTPISENAFAGLAGGIALDGRFTPGRGVHVRRLHVGRRRPALQPDRQGPAHVRRRRRRAARAAQQGRDGHRLRVPALDGPGRDLRDLRRLADRRAEHARTTTSA